MPGTVTKTLGQAGGEVALQAQALCPGTEVLGHQYHEQPGRIGREAVAGETQEPGGLGIFYVVLDMGMAAVAGALAVIVKVLE